MLSICLFISCVANEDVCLTKARKTSCALGLWPKTKNTNKKQLGDHLDVSKHRGTPKWMFIMKNPIKIHDLGVPLFLETPICRHPYCGGTMKSLEFFYSLPIVRTIGIHELIEGIVPLLNTKHGNEKSTIWRCICYPSAPLDPSECILGRFLGSSHTSWKGIWSTRVIQIPIKDCDFLLHLFSKSYWKRWCSIAWFSLPKGVNKLLLL